MKGGALFIIIFFGFLDALVFSARIQILDDPIITDTTAFNNLVAAISGGHDTGTVNQAGIGLCGKDCDFDTILVPKLSSPLTLSDLQKSNIRDFVGAGGAFVGCMLTQTDINTIFDMDLVLAIPKTSLKTPYTLCTEFEDLIFTLQVMNNTFAVASASVAPYHEMYTALDRNSSLVFADTYGRGRVTYLGFDFYQTTDNADWVSVLNAAIDPWRRPSARFRRHLLNNIYVDENLGPITSQNDCELSCSNNVKCEKINYRAKHNLCQHYDELSFMSERIAYKQEGWRCALIKVDFDEEVN